MIAATVSRGTMRFALLAAALSLGMAFGSANAKSSMAGGAGLNKGRAMNLAAMLEDISTVPEDERRGAADAFVGAAVGAGMRDLIVAVLPALEDDREEQRYYALVGLGAAALASRENGEELGDIAQALVNRLYDDHASVRETAAATLAAIQPATPDWAAGPLTDLLDDTEPRVVSAAMRALERLTANYLGLDAMQAMMDNGDAARRSRAIRVLGSQAADTTEVEVHWMLVWALQDPDAGVRWQAATAMGSLGNVGEFALQDLHAMSKSRAETPENRRAAATAFNTILD
jgi:HEAT repeat protein